MGWTRLRLGVALIAIGACSRSDISQYGQDASAVVDASKDDAIVSGCAHALPPSRPTADEDGGTNVGFYDAVRSVDFGDGGGAPVGLDLDETCTCPEADSCKVGPDAGTRCDHAGGIDDAFGDFVSTLSSATNVFDPIDLDARLTNGAFGLLVRVKSYNGLANDTSVEVAVFASAGTENGAKPKWDGSDVWTLDPNSLLGGVVGAEPVPLVAYDLDAYVADFTLVARIGDLPFVLGSVTVSLNAAIVTATLEPSGSSFRMTKGTIAGRWPTRKLLTSLQAVRDPFDANALLCGQDAVYQLFKERICTLQDVTENMLDDDKGAACRAISFAFAFDADPAKYGSALAFSPALSCGPTWSDQCP
jgi:hypothetical protein